MVDLPPDPFTGPDAQPRAVVAELTLPEGELGKVTLTVVEHGGDARQIAWWPVAAAPGDPFTVAHAEDWTRVAVLVAGELTTVELIGGAIVAVVEGLETDDDAPVAIVWDDAPEAIGIAADAAHPGDAPVRTGTEAADETLWALIGRQAPGTRVAIAV